MDGAVDDEDLRRREDPAVIEVSRGLDHVVVADTEVGDVRGLEGFYHYRQYSALDLAQWCSFEQVAHLLLEGRLPEKAGSEAARATMAAGRALPPEVAEVLAIVARGADPMQVLRTAVSAIGGELRWRAGLDVGTTEVRRQSWELCALVPTVVAAAHRLRLGLEPLAPRPELGHAANYLWMLRGEEPEARLARALEQYLILTVDHGFNASTFAARVVASTGADLASAIGAALGALSGPLHGGAPSRALEMLDAVRATGDPGTWVRAAVARGERVMGFGHRVYRTEDPRAAFLRRTALELGGDLASEAATTERAVSEALAETKPGRQLNVNVEFYAGVVMAICGVPRDLFTPTFAAGRVVGWCAHLLEQLEGNRLIRPLSRYVGPPPAAVPTAEPAPTPAA